MALNPTLLIVFISCLVFLSGDAQEYENMPEASPSSAPTSSLSAEPSPIEEESESSTETYQQVLVNGIASNNVKLPTQVEVQATVKKIEKNMMVTMQKTEDLLKVIKKRLAATPGESRSEECLKTCIEVYEEAIDGMKNSIEDLESGNFYKVNVDISAVSTDVETCEECYIEMLGEDPELKKFDEWVRGVTSECLGDLETVST